MMVDYFALAFFATLCLYLVGEFAAQYIKDKTKALREEKIFERETIEQHEKKDAE